VAVDGGMYHMAAVIRSSDPILTTRRTQSGVLSELVLAWPAHASCYHVETTSDLVAPSWSTNLDTTTAEATPYGNQLRISAQGDNRFFRLRRN
jgi:hypothetical protein